MRYFILISGMILTLASSASGETYVVNPEGTGDFPTIQAAIDNVQEGDIIELTDGTFTGCGNRDIEYFGKAITIRSQGGDPEACIIDCQGSAVAQRRGFCFHSGEGFGSVLEDVTVANGYMDDTGGGVYCTDSSSPTIVNCIFSGNSARNGGGIFCRSQSCPAITNCTFNANEAFVWGGGGIYCHSSSSPTLTNCAFFSNSADDYGGGMCCVYNCFPIVTGCTFSENLAPGGGGVYCEDNCSPTITNCTITGNLAQDGAGIDLRDHCSPMLQNTIIAFGAQGEAIHCVASATAALACCDLYGNVGGDWIGCIADQYGIDGNISEDPLFCDPENGDLTLNWFSPCAPFSEPNPECDLIGAWPVGCYVGGVTHVVNAQGTGDFPTIQAAVDAAADADTIALADGVYTGDGNRDIDYLGKAISIRSQNSDPSTCIIDCQGDSLDPHRGFDFASDEGFWSVLEDVTITNGYADVGGAVRCRSSSSPKIRRCILVGNQASVRGGGIGCAQSAAPMIAQCTLCSNTSWTGSGISSVLSSSPTLERTILAFGVQGQAVHCGGMGIATLTCCNLYGNAGGDWVGCIADQYGVNGNFSLDPCFCDPENGDYHLWNYSPCIRVDCGLVGALPMGCTDPQALGDRPVGLEGPTRLMLVPNAPNPFSSNTHIAYGIPTGTDPSRVVLSIYDTAGRLVHTLVDGPQAPGTHGTAWDGTDRLGRPTEAGIYFYRLSMGHQKLTKPMVLLR